MTRQALHRDGAVGPFTVFDPHGVAPGQQLKDLSFLTKGQRSVMNMLYAVFNLFVDVKMLGVFSLLTLCSSDDLR